MGASANQVDQIVSRLQDDEVDLRTKFSLLTEVRDSIDSYQSSPDYSTVLSKMLPEFLKLLETLPVSFYSSSPDQVSNDMGCYDHHRMFL